MNAPLTPQQLKSSWQVLLEGGGTAAFHGAWIDCLVLGLGEENVAEAVLVLPDAQERSLRPVASWPSARPCSPALATLCEQALAVRTLASRDAMLALPHAGGVLGVAFRLPQVPRQALDWLRWGLGWLQPRPEARGDESAALRERLLLALNLTLAVAGERDATAAANAFATEAAAHLGCDRVSVGFGQGRGVRLAALSNAADFSARMDLARGIEAAMDEAADQGLSLCVTDGRRVDPLDPTTEPPELASTRAHEALGRGFGTRLLMSVPFIADERHWGVVTFEWAQPQADPAALQVAAGLPAVVGRLLLDKRHAQRPWPRRLFDGVLDGARILLGPRHLPAKLVAVLVLAAVAWGVQAVGQHRVAAKAALEGGVRRVVAAPFDGFVATAAARAGEIVKAGQVLATLDDRDMRLEVEKWQSQQSQYARQMQDAQAQRNLAQIQIAMAQARQAAAQRKLSEALLGRTRVEAPFAGVIVSGDLSQSLGAAVRKGQPLFEIAPLDSYRVVIEVEEADIGYVAEGQKGELMVAALPGQVFPFTVRLVTPVAHAAEGHNLFRVEAALDGGVERLRPGMEGLAKVSIGERNQVWIWTHRFTDWLRLQAWNWLGV